MTRRILLSFLLLLSVFITASTKRGSAAGLSGAQGGTGFQHSGTAVTYKTYSNARYQFSVSYPDGLLVPQGESDNGDGQKFLSPDGRAELRVFGFYNLDGSLEDAYQAAQLYKKEESRNHQVTYKVLRKGWFVVSGKFDGRVFYLRTMLRGPVFKSLVFEYDESEKAIFDPATARISQSFRG